MSNIQISSTEDLNRSIRVRHDERTLSVEMWAPDVVN